MTTETDPPKALAAQTQGVVFAAVRQRHRTMARRAARALRAVCPDVTIDIFTDRKMTDRVFDQVHLLERKWHRPKIEALRRSRFDRTLYLDNDIIAIADGLDILDLLDRFEWVGVHDNSRNSQNARKTAGRVEVPNAFPSINSGVLAVRRTAATQALLEEWEPRMAAYDLNVDQPALRSLLWEHKVSLGIAPIEYNLMYHRTISVLTRYQTAPRFLHVRELNKMQRELGDPKTPFRIEEVFSQFYCLLLRRSLRLDETLPRRSPIGRATEPSWAPWLIGKYNARSAEAVLNRKYRAEISKLQKEAAAQKR